LTVKAFHKLDLHK